MIDKPESLLPAMDITAHALRIASAITPTPSEPTEVIAHADPVLAWLIGADDEPVAQRRRLTAAYQQLDNQRGASCEVGRFLERAQVLYAFLGGIGTTTQGNGRKPDEAEDSTA